MSQQQYECLWFPVHPYFYSLGHFNRGRNGTGETLFFSKWLQSDSESQPNMSYYLYLLNIILCYSNEQFLNYVKKIDNGFIPKSHLPWHYPALDPRRYEWMTNTSRIRANSRHSCINCCVLYGVRECVFL